MSLKGFHIVFIIFSTLLALGIGAWCIWVNLGGRRADLSRRRDRIVCDRGCADRLRRLVLSENETAAASSHENEDSVGFTLVDLFAGWSGAGVPVLLRRKGWKIDRAHGGRDLVSVWRRNVRPGWDRCIQFSSLAAWTHACRAAPGDHRGRSEQI